MPERSISNERELIQVSHMLHTSNDSALLFTENSSYKTYILEESLWCLD